VKKFDPLFISFSMEDFYKEIALQWYSLFIGNVNVTSITGHPKVVECYGACSNHNNPFIVMEYYSRGHILIIFLILIFLGSLRKVVQDQVKANEPMNWSLVVSLLIDAATALAYRNQ
jgi:serine/threonine protein kinase